MPGFKRRKRHNSQHKSPPASHTSKPNEVWLNYAPAIEWYGNGALKNQALARSFDTTVLDLGYKFQHVKPADVVQFFRPDFDSNISDPGDTNTAVYKRASQNASFFRDAIKEAFVERLKRDTFFMNDLKFSLKHVNEAYDWKLISLPLYYLTFNAIQHQPNAGVKQYFNLDTSRLTYPTLYKGHLIGTMELKNGLPILWRINKTDSASCAAIIAEQARPLAMINNIILPQYRAATAVINYAFVDSSNILTFPWYVFYGGKLISKQQTAEQYYLDGYYSNLFRSIEFVYKQLIQTEKKAPISPQMGNR